MLAGVWYDDGTVRRYEYVESAGMRRLAKIIGRDGKLVGRQLRLPFGVGLLNFRHAEVLIEVTAGGQNFPHMWCFRGTRTCTLHQL